MVLSLIIGAIILFPIIGFLGITKSYAPFPQGSMSGWANTTYWATSTILYASFGLNLLLLILLTGLLVAGLLFAATFRAYK